MDNQKVSGNKLFEAVERKCLDLVKQHIEDGISPNSDNDYGETPLSHAAYGSHHGGCPEIVSFLLESGADVNAPNSDSSTPLMLAANSENEQTVEVINILVNAGANINAINANGSTALDWVKSCKNEITYPKVIDCLRKYGAKTGEEMKEQEKPDHIRGDRREASDISNGVNTREQVQKTGQL